MTTPADDAPRPVGRPAPYFVTAAVAALFFVGWSWTALTSDRLFAFDRECAEYFYNNPLPEWWSVMVRFTELGSVGAITVLTVMGALWQASLQHRVLSLAWVSILVGAGLLNISLKTNLDRPRPPEAWRDRAVLESNYSYPSGHSMGSTVGYGLLAYTLLIHPSNRRRRAAIVLLIALVVAGVGLSRIYLRAHWFSDVIGGYSVGLAWLCFCLGGLEMRRRRKAPHDNPSRGAPE
jgi:membrane-associated phospholipid phosphatase